MAMMNPIANQYKSEAFENNLSARPFAGIFRNTIQDNPPLT
jgi:hypothetical protein